ncbi:hypothetical protein C2G38_2192057 [Gigaspora rosea]|uniref:CCHC-type domain-containing protein n=1 Tax=Gigaspora rosea TaxID=44941 RepID=A0A397V3R7_9GLOM|nr:hypothetical protein C2G38_2192057 [Gigaspora rosea]
MPSDTIVSSPSETIKKFEASLQIIKNQLEKDLKCSKSQENFIDYMEKLLVDYQNEIDKLNEKILVLYRFKGSFLRNKNSNDTIDMAQQPGSSRLSLPENQTTIQKHGIKENLDIIFDARNRFERLVLDIYPRANARAINAENRVNNPPINLNMAAVNRQQIYLNIQTALAQISPYLGQEPPDDYCNRIERAIGYADTMIADANHANVKTFTDAHKADIYKSKMAGKYLLIPPQHADNNIDTPVRFRVWLGAKYQQEMVENQQLAIQRLSEEKFMPFDTSKTYKTRIRPLLLANDLYKKVSNMVSAKPVQSKKNIKVNSNEELADRIDKLSINKALLKGFEAGVHAVVKSSKYRCSNCNRTEHNSCKCPRKKKSNFKKSSKNKKGKINTVTLDLGSDSGSDTNSSSGDDSGSDSENTSSDAESDHSLNIHKKLNEKFGTITTPLFQPEAETSKTSADFEDDEFIDDPMEIDFVQRKEPATDVVTTKCKIKRLIIPAATVNPGANFLIISKNIAKRLKLDIDTREKHDLRGIATVPTESLGIVRNVPINFAQDKYDYNLLTSKRELKLIYNGKENEIPLLCMTEGTILKGYKPLHAPAGFSLDTDNSTLAEQVPKDIFIAESKAEIITKSKKIKSLESMIKILEVSEPNHLVSAPSNNNISKYFIRRKSMDQAGKINNIISDYTDDKSIAEQWLKEPTSKPEFPRVDTVIIPKPKNYMSLLIESNAKMRPSLEALPLPIGGIGAIPVVASSLMSPSDSG